jgi:hypothetical protein
MLLLRDEKQPLHRCFLDLVSDKLVGLHPQQYEDHSIPYSETVFRNGPRCYLLNVEYFLPFLKNHIGPTMHQEDVLSWFLIAAL